MGCRQLSARRELSSHPAHQRRDATRSIQYRSHHCFLFGLISDLPRVMADVVQLQQVMMNFIINSIDAMKEVDGARELPIKLEADR